MGTQVDHKARKQEIIARSLGLFAKVGYKDVTFQKIADHCGLARTALYKYFKDKREVFNAVIADAEKRISAQYSQTIASDASAAMRLQRLCTIVIASIYENREYMEVIVDFVHSKEQAGQDMRRAIRQHTLPLRRLVHTLVVEGKRTGEFLPNVSPRAITELVYSVYESHVFRITTTKMPDMHGALTAFNAIIDSIKKETLT